ncbi:hypothetical protein BACCIP111899_02489 [Bacillus rhizoplanae]|uniref:Uncharacterized protein n=1 Tax=Bacillus rhizoplanae TaxID=2880966 RepID=A0ABN8A060_9BACI|nr:hypothetical protein BACCIP111899_02489 [Bacillus rhizoplanae]
MIFLTKFILVASYNVRHIVLDDYFSQKLFHEKEREMDDNNKDAIIASLQRHIKMFEGENKQLREQLKVDYADVYRHI